MPQQHVEPLVVLTHDQGTRPKPCGQVAQRATLSWLDDVIETDRPIQCNGCKKLVTLDDVSGDEPYTPQYRQPRTRS